MTRREALRALYHYRCGYCGVHEDEAGVFFTVDHFQPTSKGGANALDNLVYSCHAYNEFKADWWEPDSERRILHPLNDDLFSHFLEALDHRLIPLTETGRFHIEKLRLNRTPLIAHRRARYLRSITKQQDDEKMNRITALEEEVQYLRRILCLNQEL